MATTLKHPVAPLVKVWTGLGFGLKLGLFGNLGITLPRGGVRIFELYTP